MSNSKRPKPVTGKRAPDPYDFEAQARAERAEGLVTDIWVDYPGQRSILNDLRKYMRLCKRARSDLRASLTGRRLSQSSQAGKSATIQRLRIELAQEDVAAGREVNEHRVIHVTMDQRMTLKMLYQDILNRLADDFADEPGGRGPRAKASDNIKILEQRVEEWVRRLGVELIVIDEVQRLYGANADANDVTKKLQAFLDRGVVPIAFVGDETSQSFFEINPQFAARLLKPLELRPLRLSKVADRKLFMEFCGDFDAQLVAVGATAMPSVLREHDVLEGLMEVSGGHVGRVARLIQVALPAALERGAVSIERYDLSNAVRDFAISLGWIDHDPFSLVMSNAA